MGVGMGVGMVVVVLIVWRGGMVMVMVMVKGSRVSVGGGGHGVGRGSRCGRGGGLSVFREIAFMLILVVAPRRRVRLLRVARVGRHGGRWRFLSNRRHRPSPNLIA